MKYKNSSVINNNNNSVRVDGVPGLMLSNALPGQSIFVSEPVLRYGLLDHLNYLCSIKPEFETLRDALGVARREWTEITGATQITAPNYSVHDATHSHNIISYIEQLLGEEQIRMLSPTDTWMILSAAYSHDIGMYLSYKNMKEIWDSESFTDFLAARLDSSNKEIRDNANLFIRSGSLERKTTLEAFFEYGGNEFDMMGIFRLSEEMRMLLTEYRRGYHGAASEEILEKGLTAEEITGNDIKYGIQNRLHRLVAKCSWLHTKSVEEVLHILPKTTDGYRFDYAHPRFVAMLLRMGDLLDVDNDRFHSSVLETLSKVSKLSLAHKLKHACTSHILVTPERIEVASDLKNLTDNKQIETEDILETFKCTNDWYNWIEDELKNWRLEGDSFLPEGFFVKVPRLTKRDIIFENKTTQKNDIEEEFRIDYKRAFQIIGEKTFYSQTMPFIRELLQNAFDAVKFQLIHRDDDEKVPSDPAQWVAYTTDNLNEMNVELSVIKFYERAQKYKVAFVFKDSGEGLSEDAYKRLQSVGERTSRKKDKAKMLGWLRSTGEFGIGVHSAFAFSDSIRYRSYNEAVGLKFQLLLESQKKRPGSIIKLPPSLCDVPMRSRRGTDAWIIVDENEIKNALFLKDVQRNSTIETDMLFKGIESSIRKMIAPNIIPLTVNFYEVASNITVTAKELLQNSFLQRYFVRSFTIESLFNYYRTIETPAEEESAVSVGDAAVYKTKGENSYNILYIDPKHPKSIESRNVLLRIYSDSTAAQQMVAYKGSQVGDINAAGMDGISLPGLSVDFHILGRSACDTINSQRDRILSDAIPSIHNDVRMALYHFIVFLANRPDTALSFVGVDGRLAAALVVYAKCLLLDKAIIGNKDKKLATLIKDVEINGLVSLLLDRVNRLPSGTQFYEFSDNQAIKDEGINEFVTLLSSLSDGYYLVGDGLQMQFEQFMDSSFDEGICVPLWTFKIEDYEPLFVIDELHMLWHKDDLLDRKDASASFIPVIRLSENTDVRPIKANDKAVELFLRKWLSEEYERLTNERGYEYTTYIPAIEEFRRLAVEECDYNTSIRWRLCRSFIRMPQPEGGAEMIENNRLSEHYFDACSQYVDELTRLCVGIETKEDATTYKKVKAEYQRLIAKMRSIYLSTYIGN